MTPQDARKLLGGYATGTLTPAEQEALFAAALEDQELFNELAREQSLREVFADPAARATLLAALDEPRPRWWQSWRPWAAVVAMAGVGVLAVSLRKPPARPVEVARVEPRVAMSAPAQETASAPASAPARREFAPKRKAAPAPVVLPEAPKPDVARNQAGVVGGAPSGVAGGVVGGIIGGVPSPAPLPPAPAGDARQKVEINAAAPRLAFQDSAVGALRAQAPLALRYVVLRDGETVRIRFMAIVPGYLSVGGATPVPMVLTQPYTTAALTGEEVKVVFAREPVADAPLGIAPDVQERDGQTYVTTNSTSEPLVFTIPLKQP